MTYALPTALYMVAKRATLSKAAWAFNACFLAFWLAASLLAAVGSVYAIATSASTFSFFE